MSAPDATRRAAPASAGQALLLALYTETPLHAGSGQSTGVVDLPIQRERHTHFPIVPSTGVKGSLREVAERHWTGADVATVATLFGPDISAESRQGADLASGALAFSDARLLAFPVRSLTSVFLWVTCPLVLARLARDLQLADHEAAGLQVASPEPGQAIADAQVRGTVVLEDLSFTAAARPWWPAIAQRLVDFLPGGDAHRAYREKFGVNLVLLHDEQFTYLVEHATQVTARIKLNDRKTTTGDGGNLWYEETVPPDTLFYALVRPDRPRAQNSPLQGRPAVLSRFHELVDGEPAYLQLGGNETVGHGWCAVRIIEG